MKPEHSFNQKNCLDALVLLAGVARSHGVIEIEGFQEQFSQTDKNLPIISFSSLLSKAIQSPSKSLKLNALGLICLKLKSAAEITTQEFEYFKLFLVHNLTSSSSDFRQKQSVIVEKFLRRLRDFLYGIWKDYKTLVFFFFSLFFFFCLCSFSFIYFFFIYFFEGKFQNNHINQIKFIIKFK